MNTTFDLRKKLEAYLFSLLLLIALSYGGWRAYPLVAGPSVIISSPKDGEVIPLGTFTMTGKASRVKNIEIQGRSIPIDQDGNFSEILVSQSPYTILVVKATDFYDKTIVKTIRVVVGK